jgi:hypothetical protein
MMSIDRVSPLGSNSGLPMSRAATPLAQPIALPDPPPNAAPECKKPPAIRLGEPSPVARDLVLQAVKRGPVERLLLDRISDR